MPGLDFPNAPSSDWLCFTINHAGNALFGQNASIHLKLATSAERKFRVIRVDPHLANKETLQAVGKEYKNVLDCCETYLDMKTQQGIINAAGKTGKRIAAVQNLKEFCYNKLKALSYVNELQAEKLAMKKQSENPSDLLLREVGGVNVPAEA